MTEEIDANLKAGFELERLAGVTVNVRIRLGRTTLSLRDAVSLSKGDLVPFGSSVEDPVEVLVGDKVIAEGEAVVVDGNYAVRVSRIVNQQDRLRSVDTSVQTA